MNFNYRITEAITWALIADLMRRHEATAGLRVIETHPGGGQYDCRSIVQLSDGHWGNDVSFNLQSGNASCSGAFGEEQRRVEHPIWAGEDQGWDRLAYIDAVLQAEHRMQVVNLLEAKLGLPSPSRSPATTRHALSYRVMAEVAKRSILDGPVIRWENGREDTSGWEPSDPVHTALRRVPEIASLLDKADKGRLRSPTDLPGYRYWIWTLREESHADTEIVAIIDAIDCLLYRLNGKDKPLDLMNRYNEVGRDVRRLVDSLIP